MGIKYRANVGRDGWETIPSQSLTVGEYYVFDLSPYAPGKTVSYSGAVPDGLTLNAFTGIITGVPTTEVNNSYVFTATIYGGGTYDSAAVDFSTGAVSNPPVFTLAPTSVSLPSSGGVIQFMATADTTIVYSLPVTRSGITISSSTGLVTVSSSAQDTTGSITVRATAAGLSTDADCAVTVAAYVSGGPWQKLGDYYEPGVLPAYIIHPRPNAETESYAYYKWAYYDGVNAMQYRVPIGVAGMSYPFKYEVLDGPVGMTVGEQYGAPNYGIVTWTPTGPETDRLCVVRVYSQDYGRAGALPFSGLTADEYIDVEWTVSTSSTMHVFVDAVTGNDTTGTGTWSQPYSNWGWYKGNSTVDADPVDTVHANKVVVFREGNYIADGNQWPGAGTDKITWLIAGVTPFGFMNFPGHTVTIDTSLSTFFGTTPDPSWWVDPTLDNTFAYRSSCIRYAGADWVSMGINYRGSPVVRGDGQAINNSEIFTAESSSRPHRMLWFGNDMRDNLPGYEGADYKAFLVEYNAAHGTAIRVGNDNTSGMWCSNPGTSPGVRLYHMCVINNFWGNTTVADNTNWTHLNFSHVERALVQGNSAIDSNADGVWQKGWAKYWCVRDNDFWNTGANNVIASLSRDYEKIVDTNVSGGHEYWYNRSGDTQANYGSSAIDASLYPTVWPSGTAYEPSFWIRNSVKFITANTLCGPTRTARYQLYLSNNVVQFKKLTADAITKFAEYPNTIVVTSTTESVFDDTTGDLTGAYAQYAGKKGAEIV